MLLNRLHNGWIDRRQKKKIIIGYWMEETYLDSWLIIVMFILHR